MREAIIEGIQKYFKKLKNDGEYIIFYNGDEIMVDGPVHYEALCDSILESISGGISGTQIK